MQPPMRNGPRRAARDSAKSFFGHRQRNVTFSLPTRPPARVTMRRSKRRRMRRSDLVDIEAEMPFRLSNTAMRSWNHFFGQQSAGPACQTSPNLLNNLSSPCWPVVVLHKGSPLLVNKDGRAIVMSRIGCRIRVT